MKSLIFCFYYDLKMFRLSAACLEGGEIPSFSSSSSIEQQQQQDEG